MTESIVLNNGQKSAIQAYIDSGDCPGAYRYLRDISIPQALEMNSVSGSNDGSFISDFVHGATFWQGAG